MKSFPFQTVQEYALWKRDRNDALKDWLVAAVAIIAVILVVVSLNHFFPVKPTLGVKGVVVLAADGPVFTIGSPYNEPRKPVVITTGHYAAALTEALNGWESALQTKIPRPTLSFGYCQPQAIACADSESNSIMVQDMDANTNSKTIFMHEIGHLLGVPHIEGDPLMNPAYNTVLSEPTPAAIALANLHVWRAGKFKTKHGAWIHGRKVRAF